MTIIGGFNQFYAIAKLTLTQHLLKKKMIIKYIDTLYPAHQEQEQNDWKVQTECTFFLKWREKRES